MKGKKRRGKGRQEKRIREKLQRGKDVILKEERVRNRKE